VVAILNVGFRRGATVTRQVKDGDGFTTVTFPAYAPRALAGLRRFTTTLADRCLPLLLRRRLRTERAVDSLPLEGEHAPEFRALRARCALAMLAAFPQVVALLGEARRHLADHLAADDRPVDLWAPPFAVILAADLGDGGAERGERLLARAKVTTAARADAEADAMIPALLRLLAERLTWKESEVLDSKALLEVVRREMEWPDLRSTTLKGWLADLGIGLSRPGGHADRDRKWVYALHRDRLGDEWARLYPNEPPPWADGGAAGGSL
jgi:hypothetical protein